MWLILTIVGYTILSIVSILDKFLLSSAKLKPVMYVLYSTIFVLPVLVLLPFGVTSIHSSADWVAALISGAAFMLALWAMFIGFEKSKVSHIGPLIGAMTPMFVLFFSYLFLNESLSNREIIACAVLILGSMLISAERAKGHSAWHLGMLWGVLSGLLFAASNVAAKHLYDVYGFYSGFVWSRGAIGFFGIFLFLHPEVFRSVFHPTILSKIKNKISAARNKNNILLVGADKILGVLGVVLLQYATAIGSVSIVNALNGLQYAILVILVIVFSKFWPKKFKESYRAGEIQQELLAVAIIMVGLYLLV